MDVLLITVDCLRPSALALSPACQRLAAEGASFARVYAQAPWTSPALFSLFSGCNPPAHGVTSRGGRVSAGLTLLPELLRKAGWDVPNACYLNGEESYAALGWGPPVPFEEALGQRPPRRLLWTHYERCHLPYGADPHAATDPRTATDPAADPDPHAVGIPGGAAPPLPARLLAVAREHVIPRGSIDLREGDREAILTLYESSVRQMDRWLEKVLKAWGDRGPVIITADHGEEILEHGWIGHASTAEWATLYDEVLRIPLIIHGFGPARIDAMVRQIDILPTLCELVGVPLDGPVEGRSIVPLMKGGTLPDVASYAESVLAGYRTPPARTPHRVRAIRRGSWKLIVSTLGTTELYDLDTDPGERHGMAAIHPHVVDELQDELQELARASRALWMPRPRREKAAVSEPASALPGEIVVADDARYEIEYEIAGAIRGTLYAHGPRIAVDVPGRYRARRFEDDWSPWMDVAPRTAP